MSIRYLKIIFSSFFIFRFRYRFSIGKYFFTQRICCEKTVSAGMPERGIIWIVRMIKYGDTYRVILYFTKYFTPAASCTPRRISPFSFAGQIVSIGKSIFFYADDISLIVSKTLVLSLGICSSRVRRKPSIPSFASENKISVSAVSSVIRSMILSWLSCAAEFISGIFFHQCLVLLIYPSCMIPQYTDCSGSHSRMLSVFIQPYCDFLSDGMA